MPTANLELKKQNIEGRDAVVVHLHGMLSLETVNKFLENMRPEPAAHLVLDMNGIPFMDSAGVGALVSLFVSRRNRGKSFALAGLTQQGAAIVKVAGLMKLLPVFSTVEEAMKQNA